MKFRLMFAAALWLLTARPASAQFETASVVGTVHDSVATFATITGTFPARQVELGVKFIW